MSRLSVHSLVKRSSPLLEAMRCESGALCGPIFPLASRLGGVLLDRAAGFVGMIILIILGLPFSLQIVRHPEMRWGLLVAIIVAVTGFMAFLSLWRIPDVLKQWRPLRWLADLSLIAVTISRNKKGLFALIGFSLAIHILNDGPLCHSSLGLSIDITFRDTMILLPPVLLISMLPISVAGWGVREGAMVVALSFVGVPSHHSLALSTVEPDRVKPLEEMDREYAQYVVDMLGGNKTEAARLLGISRTSLWRMLKEE